MIKNKLLALIFILTVILSLSKYDEVFGQTRRTVDVRVYRGDVTTVQFRYNGDLTGDSLTFVVKANKDLSSPRLINKTTADTSEISVWYSAPYSTINVKLITQDTEDLTRTAYVYDLKKDTSTTLYDGAFTLYPAVQSRFDGTDLPGDGTRFFVAGSFVDNVNHGDLFTYDSVTHTIQPIKRDSVWQYLSVSDSVNNALRDSLVNYTRKERDETVTGNWTFSGTTFFVDTGFVDISQYSNVQQSISKLNPNFTFKGYAKVGDTQPVTKVLYDTYLASESGTIYGKTCVKGQLIIWNGTVWIVTSNYLPESSPFYNFGNTVTLSDGQFKILRAVKSLKLIGDWSPSKHYIITGIFRNSSSVKYMFRIDEVDTTGTFIAIRYYTGTSFEGVTENPTGLTFVSFPEQSSVNYKDRRVEAVIDYSLIPVGGGISVDVSAPRTNYFIKPSCIDSTTDALGLQSNAFAEQLVRIYNQNYNFRGFAEAGTSDPTGNEGDTWIAVEDGTMLGVAGVTAGQLVRRDQYNNWQAFDMTKSIFVPDDSIPAVNTTEIVSGDSSLDTDTGWHVGTGWAISGGKATHTAGSVDTLAVETDMVIEGVYQGVIKISDRTAGSVNVAFGGVDLGFTNDIKIDTNGTYTFYGLNLTALDNHTIWTDPYRMSIIPTSDFDGSIDSVSIKEMRGSNPALSIYAPQTNPGSGYHPMEIRNQVGNNNYGFGYKSLKFLTPDVTYSGNANTEGPSGPYRGNNNNVFGDRAGMSLISGKYNNIFGEEAGKSLTIGSRNNLFGDATGQALSTGDGNSVLGYEALMLAVDGNYNIAYGFKAIRNAKRIQRSIGIGYFALQQAHYGDYLIGIGHNTGANLDSSKYAILIGKDAGNYSNPLVNDSLIIMIGRNTGKSVSSNLYNSIVIGDDGRIDKSNQIKLGNNSTTEFYPKGRIKMDQITAELTDGTPTDAEIDSATGLTPSTAGAGYQVTIKDTSSGVLYRIESNGTDWFYTIMVKAL